MPPRVQLGGARYVAGAMTSRTSPENSSMVGAFAVGDWIGSRFQIFDVHEGGMSLVYVVNDQTNGPGPKVVALKTLRSELLRSRVRVSRFATECRLWVQLGEHPEYRAGTLGRGFRRQALRGARVDPGR